MATPCKTVFIAYPHNPEAYVYIEPPEGATPQMMEEFAVDERRHYQRQQLNIQTHMKLVHSFANFLEQHRVKVYYDQQTYDTGCANLMKWSEEKIEESDYIILVVTPSLLDFLRDEVPIEEEPLFVVFLDRRKDSDLLPVGLKGGSVFEICQPFSIDPNYRRADDLDKLYAQLTGQNLYQPPVPSRAGPVPLSGRGRLGRGRSSMSTHYSILQRLSNIQACLTDHQIVLISDKSKFHTRWRLLAPCLGLSPSQIEECDGNNRGQGDAEKCYEMLKVWRDSRLHGPPNVVSVAFLARVVYEPLNNMEMLETLGDVFC